MKGMIAMETGWIKMHRKIVDWQWYKDVPCCRLFEHLVLTVNYTRKTWQTYTINPGEKITSLENLAFETGLSVQQVRSAIKKLKSTGEITSKTTNKFTLITITNWDNYQSCNTPDNKQITNEQQANNKQITTTKERKKEKNERMKEKRVRVKLPYQSLPEEWEIWCVTEMGWTREQALSAWPNFYDYWNSTDPKDPKKSDWFTTFKNSVRNGITKPLGGKAYGQPTKTDRLKAAAQRGLNNIARQGWPEETSGYADGGFPESEGIWPGTGSS